MFYKRHLTIVEFLQAVVRCGAVGKVHADGRGDCVY